jgi:hypothetical protein
MDLAVRMERLMRRIRTKQTGNFKVILSGG